jgi:phage-related protein
MKPIRFHPAVIRAMDELDGKTREDLVHLLALLREGRSLGMPISRPMPIVSHGVHELRLRDRLGQIRVFYFTKIQDAILVFHLFRKKTQHTPAREIETGRRRLKEMA